MPADWAISMSWFKCWEAFLNGVVSEPPGPIDNSRLIDKSEGKVLGMFYLITIIIFDLICFIIIFRNHRLCDCM